ncbi:MAG: hypothetical protein EOO78_30000 [Oxalobacteraceae bacterium]|nr:MAG: hypothetical protein EOO78_30000 [Oxalobacteraceae bacterium]
MTDTQLSPGLAEDAALQLEHDLTSIVRAQIGMHESMAALFAQALVQGMRREFGGQHLYIPAPGRGERDAAIRSQFNGANLAEVMKRHDVSRSTVYRVSGRRDPRSVQIGMSSAKNPIPSLSMGQGAE